MSTNALVDTSILGLFADFKMSSADAYSWAARICGKPVVADLVHPTTEQSATQPLVQDLESLRIDKVFERDLQGVSQQPHVVDGHVSLSALYLADVRP